MSTIKTKDGIASVPPLMLKTDSNPGGLPLSVFYELRSGVQSDRAQFFKHLRSPFLASQAGHSRCIAAMAAHHISHGWRDCRFMKRRLRGEGSSGIETSSTNGSAPPAQLLWPPNRL
jgi:hypothetical protein